MTYNQQQPPIWHGTDQESTELLAAIEFWCRNPAPDGKSCTYVDGARTVTCAGHMMLLTQRTLDGLLYARRTVECWRREEFARKGKKLPADAPADLPAPGN